MSDHSLFTAAHRPFAAIYADATARLAATGFPRGVAGAVVPFTSDDLYKEVLQLSNHTTWALTDESPITWEQTGGAGLGGPPSGSAGGDLTGTYPSPTLATAGPGATGPIGDGTNVPVVTIDAKGRVTGLTSTAITGAAPTGSAGGDLAGSYPNPTVSQSSAAFAFSGDISPAQLTANTDNWNPTGLSGATTIRLSTDASRNITGLQGGADGRLMILHNIGSQNAVLKDESGSSTAGNRFALNADVTLGADQSALLQYDATSSRWRLVAGPSASGGGIGGSTGSTDNAILRADGTGGSTAQGSAVLIDDTTGKITLPSGAGDKIVLGSSNFGIGTEAAENAVTIWAQDSFRFRGGGTTVGAGTEALRVMGGTTTPASITDGVLSVNVLGVKLIKLTSSTGDKILWQNGSTSYGTGVESDNCVTHWSQDRHRWRIGGSSVTSGTETMVLTGGTLAFTNGTALAFTPRTASQITANQNNYNPGGQSKFQRWSSDASRDVTGLTFSTTQLTGEEHTIVNVGSNNIVLKHQDASSTAANRFLCSTGADITLGADQAADLIYDGTTGRWRVFKKN